MKETAPTTPTQEGRPETEQLEEQRRKTLAVRLDESMHAQLHFIAQLSGNSIADEIRQAIETRINAAQDDPDLIARAERVRQEIEREAAARAAAISGFLGTSAVAATTTSTTKKTGTRSRSSAPEQ